MITGDRVQLLEWKAAPELVGRVGTVKRWREVGRELHNINFEYLVDFGFAKPKLWVPARYLRGL
jgi:hypothetical protein